MIIYHGEAGGNRWLEQAREAAPSYTHGNMWTPNKMTPKDRPYALDNGAFAAYANGELWPVDSFVGRLNQLESMPRDPDFVVLPDVVTNPKKTRERSSKWAGLIDYPTAFAVQDGIKPDEAVEFAQRIGADYLFVGGTVRWKRATAEGFVEAGHESGLKVHIGRPGNLVWARDIGADSVDTTHIVRDGDWWKLENLENNGTVQTDLTTGEVSP